jgi:hypothetical protein
MPEHPFAEEFMGPDKQGTDEEKPPTDGAAFQKDVMDLYSVADDADEEEANGDEEET